MKKLILLAIALISVHCNFAQNLVASYPFNGAANDATGNAANNGTVNGATLTTDRFGNANAAYYFDGINNFIEANADNLPTGNSTISLWFNADVGSMANRPGVFGYGGNTGGCPGNSQIMILNLSGGNNFTTQAHCLNNYASYTYSAAPENKWYNWVVTTNETNIKMYLNGELISTANTNTRPKIVAGKKMSIGAVVGPGGTSNYTDANVGRFKGVLDDVKIYDWYLTDKQVADKYVAESVVACYSFSGNTLDQSGNNNDGNNITTASLVTDRFGNANAAYNFTTADFIEVLNSTSFQIGTNDYTLQYWIKTIAADAVIMGKGPHTVLGIMQYVNADGTIQARSEYPAGILNSDIAINNDVWHQVVFVRKGTTSKIFIDGRLSNSATLPLSDISNTDSFYIGHDGPEPFAGGLDDIKLYSAALSDVQIFDNYIKDQTLPGSGNGLQLTRSGTRATDPWVNIGEGYDFGNEPFTYETWLKRDDLHTTENDYGLGLIIGENNGTWGVGIANNNTIFFTKIGVNASYSTGVIADTKWHHVAVVYNGTELKFYIDGILAGNNNYTDNFNGNSSYTIGARQSFGNTNGDQTINGMIDESRIWRNVALSELEIRDWMCKKVTSSHPQYSKVFAYFNFDEDPISLPMARKSAIVLNPTVRGFGGHFGELINESLLQTSGAAIGNDSDHDYISTINKSALIGHTTGENFLVESITGDPAGIQLYRVDEAPSNLTGHNGLDPFPTYYGVFQAGGTNPTYTGTYTYYGNQIPGGVEANLRLYSRENNASATWIENASLPDMPNDKIVLTGQSTEYILGSALTTLPLNLLSFSGKNTVFGNILNWQTANEIALSHFEIEVSSPLAPEGGISAQKFEKIGEVKANGGPSEKVEYEFIAPPAPGGGAFFRLKMIDLDGKFKYSKIIFIENKHQSELKVYPNPTTDYFSISGNQSFEKLQIVDALGRIVKEFLPNSDNKYSLNELNNGVYFLKNIGGNELINSKLIVK